MSIDAAAAAARRLDTEIHVKAVEPRHSQFVAELV